mmetsp:Transcript_45747/g.108951  ORF Transcript_45747/g.108951 Transcript_45747/m.108951 type:complete len:215 (-) Transcript_45747:80-724(-)
MFCSRSSSNRTARSRTSCGPSSWLCRRVWYDAPGGNPMAIKASRSGLKALPAGRSSKSRSSLSSAGSTEADAALSVDLLADAPSLRSKPAPPFFLRPTSKADTNRAGSLSARHKATRQITLSLRLPGRSGCKLAKALRRGEADLAATSSYPILDRSLEKVHCASTLLTEGFSQKGPNLDSTRPCKVGSQLAECNRCRCASQTSSSAFKMSWRLT